MPHIPEHQLAVVEKGARGKQAGHVGAHHLDPVPLPPDLLRIGLNADDVNQRDFEFAAERPELIQALKQNSGFTTRAPPRRIVRWSG
jgi:hypothetical protein